MNEQIEKVKNDMSAMMDQWKAAKYIEPDEIFVVGCSTSEVVGKAIGTFGSHDVAEILYEQLAAFSTNEHVHLAFQCCEHLNRALVVEKEVAKAYGLEIVSVIPKRDAGGSMATYAFEQMKEPVVVESIAAHAGMDIGDTFIGMHIKAVAVPVRFDRHEIGAAHVTLVRRRPKLIGGSRAVYLENR